MKDLMWISTVLLFFITLGLTMYSYNSALDLELVLNNVKNISATTTAIAQYKMWGVIFTATSLASLHYTIKFFRLAKLN